MIHFPHPKPTKVDYNSVALIGGVLSSVQPARFSGTRNQTIVACGSNGPPCPRPLLTIRVRAFS
jgi:hypothetical protein